MGMGSAVRNEGRPGLHANDLGFSVSRKSRARGGGLYPGVQSKRFEVERLRSR